MAKKVDYINELSNEPVVFTSEDYGKIQEGDIELDLDGGSQDIITHNA